MKSEIQIFLDKVERVLNGRTFFLTIEYSTGENIIKDEELIKNIILSKEFDLKLIEADITQQDGDFFHELILGGEFTPKINSFKKNGLQISNLDTKSAYKYLVSMLNPKTYDRFISFYQQEINEDEAKAIVNSFLNSLENKNEFRFYKLETDFIFQSFDFWHGMGCDSVTAILADKKIFFLFTNGGD